MLMTICDDDRFITEYIKNITQTHFPQIDVVTFQSARKMTEYIVKENIPDIIISDICVGEEDSIDELKQISDRIRHTRLIFFTGFFLRCQDIFLSFNPYGLLTKPLEEKKILYYLNKIVEEEKKSDIFYIFFRGNRFRLSYHQVMYVESSGRKVIYYTKEAHFEEYIKLDQAIQKTKGYLFRCHKSYAVNPRYIYDVGLKECVLKNGTTIPVSRNHHKETKVRYMEYLAQK